MLPRRPCSPTQLPPNPPRPQRPPLPARLRSLLLRAAAFALCVALYPQCAPTQRVPSLRVSGAASVGGAGHVASGCSAPVPVSDGGGDDLPAYQEDHLQGGAHVGVSYDNGSWLRAGAHLGYAVGGLIDRATAPGYPSRPDPSRSPYHLGEAGAHVSLWAAQEVGLAVGFASMWGSAPDPYIVPFARVHVGLPEDPWSGAVQFGPDHLLLDGRLFKGTLRYTPTDALSFSAGVGVGGRPIILQDPAHGGLVFGTRSRALIDLIADLSADIRLSDRLSLHLSLNGGTALPAGVLGLSYAWALPAP